MADLFDTDSDDTNEIVNTAKRVLKLRDAKVHLNSKSKKTKSDSDKRITLKIPNVDIDNFDMTTVSVDETDLSLTSLKNDISNISSKNLSVTEKYKSSKKSKNETKPCTANKSTLSIKPPKYALRSRMNKKSMTHNAISKRTKKAVKGFTGDIDLDRWEVKRNVWNSKDINTIKIVLEKSMKKLNLVIMRCAEISIG